MNRRLETQEIADLLFGGDLKDAQGFLKTYKPPKFGGLLFGPGGSPVRAFGPACQEKSLADALNRANFRVLGHWAPSETSIDSAVALVRQGVPVAEAARRCYVNRSGVYAKLKQIKSGVRCPTCGKSA